MSSMNERMRDLNEELGKIFAEEFPGIFGRQPRYVYYEFMGRRYCWTTERMSDGKFHAFEYRPMGKGSRTPRKGTYHAKSNATKLKLVREIKCATRKRAKALATKWHNEYAKIYWDKHTTPVKEG